MDLIGFKVEVAYSAGNPDELVMSHPSIEPRVIRPLVIGEFVGPAPKLTLLVRDTHSRMLRAMETQEEEERRGATSFRDLLDREDA